MQIRTINLGHEQLLIVEEQRGCDGQVIFGGSRLNRGCRGDRIAASVDEVAVAARQRSIFESVGAVWIDVNASMRAPLWHRLATALRRWRDGAQAALNA